MTDNIVRIKRKPRPLTKTYSTTEPYVIERHDQDDGSIIYDIFDERQDSYRFVCSISDEMGCHPYAKSDAEHIVRGLNMLVQFGMEILPKIKD